MRTVFFLLPLLLLSPGCMDGKLEFGGLLEEQTALPEPGDAEGREGDRSPFGDLPVPPYREPNPQNRNSDVDCDGIPDWEELVLGTNPLLRDTDGDGIWDGIEIGRHFSPDPLCANFFPQGLLPPTTRTNPLRQDTDCDGISDGDEDKNKNGRVDPGETDPSNPDTDKDGLWDGTELQVTPGMILLGGQMVPLTTRDELCESRQLQRASADCPQDFRRKTDPTDADTDKDGIPDGVEDINKNGCYEPNLFEDEDVKPPRGPFYAGDGKRGETDPTVADVNAVTKNACLETNLVKVDIRRHVAAQIALGLPMNFLNSNRYVDIQRSNALGISNGLMGLDVVRNVAFVAWQHPVLVANLTALRNLATSQAASIGSTSPTIQTFRSWDAPPGNADEHNAVSVLLQLPSDPKAPGTPLRSPAARANLIANTLLGATSPLPGVPTALQADGAEELIQHVRAQYVLRADGKAMVVMAVALSNDSVQGGDGYFGLMDVAGGAALASYLDRTAVQCERSVAEHRPVDFLFVVDDSGSMAASQKQLAAVADAMGTALGRSTLDWRVAMVASSYHTGGHRNTGIIRGFTTSIELFKIWLTRDVSNCAAVSTCRAKWMPGLACSIQNPNGTNNGCGIGTYGNGAEGMLGAARLALIDMHHVDADEHVRFRPEAEIAVIILTDTEDHTSGLYASVSPGTGNIPDKRWEEVDNFVDFFTGKTTRHVVPGINNTVPGFVDQGPRCPAPGCLDPVRPGVIPVHAIYCPGWRANEGCSTLVTPSVLPTRIQKVVEATNGFLAPISDEAAFRRIIVESIVAGAVGKAGVKTQKPLIGASLRVAIDNPNDPEGLCRSEPNEVSGANVPRSRVHGFDYNGIEQTVSFFGNCRPPKGQKRDVALSYRAWEKSTKRFPCEDDIRFVNNPALDYCTGPFICDFDKDMCVCPEACGGTCKANEQCDAITCSCVAASIIG